MDYSVFAIIVIVAFVGEYADSTLGMGYGTLLTPIFLMFGFSADQIVPAILASELVTGAFGALMHHKVGNVEFGRGTPATKAVMILAICASVGVVLSVFLSTLLPKNIVKLYIGVMLVGVSIFLIFGKRFIGKTSMKKLSILGAVASFNKGISGGGFGPLLMGGQIAFGEDTKAAIGITSLTESLVCAVGLVAYFLLSETVQVMLFLPLIIGATLAVPLSAISVKKIPKHILTYSITFCIMGLGIFTVVKTLLK